MFCNFNAVLLRTSNLLSKSNTQTILVPHSKNSKHLYCVLISKLYQIDNNLQIQYLLISTSKLLSKTNTQTIWVTYRKTCTNLHYVTLQNSYCGGQHCFTNVFITNL